MSSDNSLDIDTLEELHDRMKVRYKRRRDLVDNIKKGDRILYLYGFSYVEAKVIKDYSGGFIKVRHNDYPFPLNLLLGYREVIKTSEVLGKVSRSDKKEMGD